MKRRVYVEHDEWYPVFFIDTKSGVPVDLDEEVIARVELALAEFSEVQDILEQAQDG